MDIFELKPVMPEPPQNESSEHFYLKQIAKIWLKTQRGCQFVASEIHLSKGKNNGREKRKISDVVGIKKAHIKGQEYNYTVFNIEVKVSKSDFLSGFNSGGNYNWIMTPKGLLEKKDIPENIGLIEVDIENFSWQKKGRIDTTKGLEVVISAKKQKLTDKYTQKTLEDIARKLTNEDVFKNNWIRPELIKSSKRTKSYK